MKKNKLSVIFFLLCIISFFIYRKFEHSNLNYLYIGDSKTYYENSFHYLSYIYDSIEYKKIRDNIVNNSYKVIKKIAVLMR